MDVIVTDHHLPSGELPRAVAVVDPHRLDCAYPDPDLTGAGIAFKLASALLARRGRSAADLAGVAAIGTIADMAPMTGESRAIVRLGLAELAATSRPGLRALLARSAESPAEPTARDLAFGVAPRINSAGRIADAELAISLLLEDDPAAAERIADELERVHLERRAITTVTIDEARLWPPNRSAGGPLALAASTGPPGVLGLVANRLVESLGRPVAVAAPVEDELRGSVRGPADFHVALALEACAGLTKRGGHPAAGGFSLRARDWPAFVDAFAALPRPFPEGRAAALEDPDRWRSTSCSARGSPGTCSRGDRPPGALRSRPRRAAAGRHRAARRRGAPGRGDRGPSLAPHATRTRDLRRDRLRDARTRRCRSQGSRSTWSGPWSSDRSRACRAFGCGSSTTRRPRRHPFSRRRVLPVAGGGRRPDDRSLRGSRPPRRTNRAARRPPVPGGITRTPIPCPTSCRGMSGVETFARGLLDAAGEHAAAVKVNVAFFEAFGSAGWAALERVRRPSDDQASCSSTRSGATSAPRRSATPPASSATSGPTR